MSNPLGHQLSPFGVMHQPLFVVPVVPVFWVSWVGFNPLWASLFEGVEEWEYHVWRTWQEEIRGQNLDKSTRREKLIAAFIQYYQSVEPGYHYDPRVKAYIEGKCAGLAERFLGMEGDLGADKYGHVKEITETTTTTTTNTTVTNDQRKQVGDYFLEQLNITNSNMSEQDAQKMYQAILQGQKDELVKEQMPILQSCSAQQPRAQPPAPQPQPAPPPPVQQQQPQQQWVQQQAPAPQYAPSPPPAQQQTHGGQQYLHHSTVTTTTTTSNNQQFQGQQQMPGYQQQPQNYGQPQYHQQNQAPQTPQPQQQLSYQQPLQITAGPSTSHPPAQFNQQGQQYQQQGAQQGYQQVHTQSNPQQQMAYQQAQQGGGHFQGQAPLTKDKKPKKHNKHKY